MDLTAALRSDVSIPGKLKFGFSTGGELKLTSYRLFTESETTDFVAALEAVFDGFSIPGDIDDLERMPVGAVATVDRNGSLKFSGQANLLSVVNPLASVSLPGPLGDLSASSGGSIQIRASFLLSGEYQIRVHKRAENQVRLGFHRKQGSQFHLSASISAGLSVQLRKFELTEMLLKGMSKDPKVDAKELKAGGLAKAQVQAIEGAIKAGIERSLELALRFEYGSLASDAAAFLYDLDLQSLGEAGQRSLRDALDGDLSALVENEESLPSGISLVRSIFTNIRSEKHSFKMNLLGVYNYVSISRLILKGTVLYDAETGELTITDTATASRIQSHMVNFGLD